MPLGTFLDGRAPTTLRGLEWLSLTESGYRLTLGGTADSGGGVLETWGTAGTVACRVDPMGGAEDMVAERLSDRSTHLFTCPAGTAITHNDRFKLLSATYEVTAVRSRTNDWAVRFEAVQIS